MADARARSTPARRAPCAVEPALAALDGIPREALAADEIASGSAGDGRRRARRRDVMRALVDPLARLGARWWRSPSGCVGRGDRWQPRVVMRDA